jgi:deoxyadenosine/deoxycytidine kinase
MMAYISRLALLQNAISNLQARGGGIIICERSLLCDRYVFASMLRDADDIDAVEFSIYEKWFDHFIASLPRHYMFYLRTDPETAFTRVKLRNRAGESIQLSYLKTCHEYHERWLDCPRVLIVNANEEKGILVYKRWLSLLLRAEIPDQNCVSASV